MRRNFMKTGWYISLAAHIILALALWGLSWNGGPKAQGTLSLSIGGGSGHAGRETLSARRGVNSSEATARTNDSAVHRIPEASESANAVSPWREQRVESEQPISGGTPTGTGQAERDETAGGTGTGHGRGNSTGTGAGSGPGNNPFAGSGFADNGDGTYTAGSAEGIQYTILQAVDPVYPQEAVDAGYSRTITAEVRFVVGLSGYVEQVQILNDVPELGFSKAIREALSAWRFAPITYKGIPIKCTFRKNFRFNPQ